MQDVSGVLANLHNTVKQVLKVPYYKQRLMEVGIENPEDIQKIEDFQLIPLTEKEDLRKNYPFGLFAEPLDKIVRVHASSGTTGKPTVVGYTREDIKLWAEIVANGLRRVGITSEDVIQIAY